MLPRVSGITFIGYAQSRIIKIIIYHASFSDINNGVYKAGFATQQGAYEEAAYQLFKSLDHVSNYQNKINTIHI